MEGKYGSSCLGQEAEITRLPHQVEEERLDYELSQPSLSEVLALARLYHLPKQH